MKENLASVGGATFWYNRIFKECIYIFGAVFFFILTMIFARSDNALLPAMSFLTSIFFAGCNLNLRKKLYKDLLQIRPEEDFIYAGKDSFSPMIRISYLEIKKTTIVTEFRLGIKILIYVIEGVNGDKILFSNQIKNLDQLLAKLGQHNIFFNK